MKRRKIVYWVTQFVTWGIFCSIVAIANIVNIQGGEVHDKDIASILKKVFFLYFLLVFISHLMRTILIKSGWLELKIIKLIPRSLLLVVSSSILLLLLSRIGNYFLFQEVFTFLEFFINIWMYTLLLSVWLAIYLTNHLIDRARNQEMQALILLSSKAKTELKILRDQLNPHFLFNSLNSIRALIGSNPDTAKTAITTLSNLLRSSLSIGKKTFITLEEEIDLVLKYLELEKIRYEDRLRYNIHNEIDHEVKIPPFFLQSLVENGIKHGISKLIDGGDIDIYIREEGDYFIMEVLNSGHYTIKNKKGIGLENIKKRLEIVYEKEANFTIENKEGRVSSIIKISLTALKTPLLISK